MNVRGFAFCAIVSVAPAALAGLALVGMVATGSQAQSRRLDVVELFTSQGCSSCPPADSILAEMAERDDVLALSFNVDYWDYLGWKDTLAQPGFTGRQKAYAHARGDRAVYTPQAVVNGMMHAVGSDRTGLKNARQSTGDRLDKKAIPLSLKREGNTIQVEAGAANSSGGRQKPATVWMVVFDPARTVEIERGENRGRTITYRNVVRSIEKIGTWKGAPLSLSVPMPAGSDARCAVLVQEGDGDKPGAILAAARL